MLLDTLGLLILGFILLIISSQFLVKSLTRIAVCLDLNEFIIGFIIVALATSIPELIIGIDSALAGKPTLALGNVLGANIIDLTLVVGIIVLLKRGITIETKTVKTDSFWMLLIAILPLLLISDGELTPLPDGVLLIGAFCVYLWRLFSQEKRFRERLTHADKKELYPNLIIAVVFIVILFISADFVVDSSIEIADKYLGVPYMLVGLFLISFGTTLPELTFETRAIFMKHKYLALGDLIGSVVTNSSLVLGVTTMIHPIKLVDPLIFMTSGLFLIVVAALFTTLVEVERHILWQEGVILIMLYILFMIIELNLKFFQSGGVLT